MLYQINTSLLKILILIISLKKVYNGFGKERRGVNVQYIHFYFVFLKGDSHVSSSVAMRNLQISDLHCFHPVSPSSAHGSPVLESSLLRQLMCTAPEKRGTALTINPNKAVLSINCTTLQVPNSFFFY